MERVPSGLDDSSSFIAAIIIISHARCVGHDYGGDAVSWALDIRPTRTADVNYHSSYLFDTYTFCSVSLNTQMHR